MEVNPVLDGSIPGDVGFDPLGLAKTKEDLYNYREAELKHARLSNSKTTLARKIRETRYSFRNPSLVPPKNQPHLLYFLAVCVCALPSTSLFSFPREPSANGSVVVVVVFTASTPSAGHGVADLRGLDTPCRRGRGDEGGVILRRMPSTRRRRGGERKTTTMTMPCRRRVL